MALAMRCDICKRYYPCYEGINTLTLGHTTNHTKTAVRKFETITEYDCCPDCLATIEARISHLADMAVKDEP